MTAALWTRQGECQSGRGECSVPVKNVFGVYFFTTMVFQISSTDSFIYSLIHFLTVMLAKHQICRTATEDIALPGSINEGENTCTQS